MPAPTTAAADQRVRWYSLATDDVLDRLEVDASRGLDGGEAARRRDEYGPNELEQSDEVPAWRVFLAQYADFMQLLLLGAAVISFVIDQQSTAALLFVLTLFNAAMGYRQQTKAEAAVAALAEMMQVTARVRRGGEIVEVDARDLVPGDVVSLEAGDLVPADGRVLSAATLEIEESALTGESQPAAKDPASVAAAADPVDDPAGGPGADPGDAVEVPLGDRHDMAYMNTQVTRGTGTFVVTETGMSTEMGHIAGMLGDVSSDASPLQRQMNQLAKVFAWLAAGTIFVMVVAGSARGLPRDDLFLLAVTVAIGAIPTGLPTVVTTLLSIGTRDLAEHNAVVKDLSSTETLGSTSAICSDKTGTLTLNQMTTRRIATAGVVSSVEGEGYRPIGAITHPGGVAPAGLADMLTATALCSDATVRDGELIGDPTEGALVTVAAKGGVDVGATRDEHPRVGEVPFDSAYKFMATFHDWTDAEGAAVVRCFVKGAPDVVLGRSSTAVGPGGRVVPTGPGSEGDEGVQLVNAGFARQGLRVLAVATRDVPAADFDPAGALIDLVADLELLGLYGIVDPPRPEARDAIATAREAGVRVRMITGDHAVTAAAIADELGIEGEAVTGADLDRMDDDELSRRVDDIGVFGRVAPEHKVRLVTTLRDQGKIVAMTGDGVNDAPALKAADIGVAMGITGTEVSKQAARMVLTDDNFATIVESVGLGRRIYDNLMKYVRFQTASLVSFVTVFVGATVFDIADGAPLNPLQILWVNFVITSVLAIALGFDTASPDLMRRRPRDPGEPVLTRPRIAHLTLQGAAMGVVTLLAVVLSPGVATLGAATTAGTMALVTLSLGTIVAAVVNRVEHRSVFSVETLSNPRFNRSLLVATVATVLSAELGMLQRFLDTVGLTARQWMWALLGAAVVLAVDELRKVVERMLEQRRDDRAA